MIDSADGYAADASRTTILVVDDDLDSVSELCDAIDSLGHNVKGVESVRSALHVIENDPSVKIVMADIRMEGLDGFDLLAEIDARYGLERPITKIVVSGFEEYDYAVEAMRHGAIDLLKKPCGVNSIKSVIRRALLIQRQLASAAGTSFAESFEFFGGQLELEDANEQLKLIKRLQKERAFRTEIIDCGYLAEPAWDILLDLSAAKITSQKVSVSSACAATDAPFSTALRYANRLVEDGYADRYEDPTDKRRNMLELTDFGLGKIQKFISRISKM